MHPDCRLRLAGYEIQRTGDFHQPDAYGLDDGDVHTDPPPKSDPDLLPDPDPDRFPIANLQPNSRAFHDTQPNPAAV